MSEAARFHWLLHLDLDQFQVAAERRRRSELVGEQVIVGGDGDPSKARQVVTCASYETRDLGVRAGMPLRAAYRKAPGATYLPLDMEFYEQVSSQVWEAVRALGHPVEVWGADEGYVGFGPRDLDPPPEADAVRLADDLRAAIRARTGLESCVGISDNKQRAKIAAGFAKRAVRAAPLEPRRAAPLEPRRKEPRSRCFTLTDATWFALMGERPADALWSVGSRTAKRLSDNGIETVAQLATTPLDTLIGLFGPHKGNWLYVLARGGGDDSIALVEPPAKSHSKSRTYPEDLTGRAQLHAAAHDLLRDVLAQVVDEGRIAVRVGVTTRSSTFFTKSKMRKLAAPTVRYDDVAPTVDALLDALIEPAPVEPVAPVEHVVQDPIRPVRLLSVRLELADRQLVVGSIPDDTHDTFGC
ncbi:DNA polymerase IV [Gordonia iterans]|uniref:DNA-directed DNA polymerase n=1 Tax=Gordonia iterans TaxID=1004901 RepID=A0A2S0KIV2_9ACTN|nr:DNA polymerase IV [Gordonia iterans]AVM01622.1 DNA polymerase IV [Gordonia iterans]